MTQIQNPTCIFCGHVRHEHIRHDCDYKNPPPVQGQTLGWPVKWVTLEEMKERYPDPRAALNAGEAGDSQ